MLDAVVYFYIFLCLSLDGSGFSDAALFYPAATVLQITSSVSAPIILKDRKIFFDWGIQQNYNMPTQPDSFYNSTIWEDQFDVERRARSVHNGTADYTPVAHSIDGRHVNDYTAGQLYIGLEQLLVEHGFDASCLLRSVCELARHPFADEHRNILTELLTFVLTPSLHEAFGATEQLYAEVYAQAELHGFLGADCALAYPDCRVDFLHGISKLLT